MKKTFKKKVETTKDFFLKYKWLLLAFIPFLIHQSFHILQQHWDTQAFIFGGKWFCGEQIYLELIRPPLPSFLNCVFGAGEFALLYTTIFACFLFLAGSILLYKKYSEKIDQMVFALFLFVAPWSLYFSNYGSDLLAIALLMIALGLGKNRFKGFFFALSTLSRYNFLMFAPIFLFEMRKKPRDMLVFLTSVLIVWTPWMIFNYAYTGNFLFSVYESTVLNVFEKTVAEPLLIIHLLIIGLFILLFFLTKWSKNAKEPLVQISGLAGASFLLSKIRETRFLNAMFPAIAFLAAKLSKKYSFAKMFLVLLLLLTILFVPSPQPQRELEVPEHDFLKECRVATDMWVYFYEKGIVAEVSYDIGDWNKFIESGGNLVLYHEYDFDSIKGEKIFEEEYVIIKSDSCAPQPEKYISGTLRNYVLRWQKQLDEPVLDYSDWYDTFEKE